MKSIIFTLKNRFSGNKKLHSSAVFMTADIGLSNNAYAQAAYVSALTNGFCTDLTGTGGNVKAAVWKACPNV